MVTPFKSWNWEFNRTPQLIVERFLTAPVRIFTVTKENSPKRPHPHICSPREPDPLPKLFKEKMPL